MIKHISIIVGVLLFLMTVNPVFFGDKNTFFTRKGLAQNPIVDLGAEGIKIAGSGSIALINTIIETLGASGGLLGALISIVLGIVNGFFSFILSLVSSSIVSCITSFMSSALMSAVIALVTSAIVNILAVISGIISVINGIVEYASLLCSGALGACYGIMDIPIIVVWLVAFVLGVPIMALAFIIGDILLLVLLVAEFIWSDIVKLFVGGIAGIAGTLVGLCPGGSIVYGILGALLFLVWVFIWLCLRMAHGFILGVVLGIFLFVSPFAALISPRGGMFLIAGDVVNFMKIFTLEFTTFIGFTYNFAGVLLPAASSWIGGIQGGAQWVVAWASAICDLIEIIALAVLYLALDIIAAILWIIGVVVTLYDGCMEVTKVLDIF